MTVFFLSSTVLLTVRVNLDVILRFCYAGEMKEPLTIRTERVDDIPLLQAHMQRMGIARLLDAHFPTHGNRQGLSLGGEDDLADACARAC